MKLVRTLILAVSGMISLNAAATLIIDEQDHSSNTATEYFVDVDSNKDNSPYYRGAGEDWGWMHNGIAGTFTSITLDISAYDVDSPDEVDNISVWDGNAFISLGSLTGINDSWEFTQFDLSGYAWANDQVNAGLQVKMDIDANSEGWLVTLAKSVLIVDDGQGGNTGGCNPTPGVPCTQVPEPGTFIIFALGLVGLAARTKLSVKK
ncbi:PEP-CTERM sorting domain-containing protein [Thalassotalea sediminis]|uniref:PEP-CTERM sorting domain-containing protein n=1 Tax=Thalassotalea sediminis TaxID=1759089 RepID=UPI0025739570|nr:PEP-CTERM sorting domain-containing protein [Thalassotalea sediminis]